MGTISAEKVLLEPVLQLRSRAKPAARTVKAKTAASTASTATQRPISPRPARLRADPAVTITAGADRNCDTPEPVASASTSSAAPSTAGATRPAKKQLTVAQLATCTVQNTQRNKKLYNTLDTVVVYRDEPRPPSPSSKLRKIGAGESREDRAKKRGALRESVGGADPGLADAQGSVAGFSSPKKRKHSLAPGDEEGGYTSPAKKAKVVGSESGKVVKWDRDLVRLDDMEVPPCVPPTADIGAVKSILVKVRRGPSSFPST